MRIDEQILFYGTLLDKLDNLREVNQMKLLDFAHHLVRQEGQKYVFLFYQREYIPQVDPKIIATYISLYQDNYYVYHTLTRAAGPAAGVQKQSFDWLVHRSQLPIVRGHISPITPGVVTAPQAASQLRALSG